MKALITITVFGILMIASARNGVAADGAANWSHHCASCHGKDGKGDTGHGQKIGRERLP